MKTKKRRDTTVAILSFAAIMVAWWAGTEFTNVNKVFLPSPQQVFGTMIELARDGSLWEHTWCSTYRVLIGWVLSVVAALPLGMLAATSRVCRSIFQPITEFMRYLPVVALVPLTLLYFGIGESQKYAIIFLGTFFQLMLMVEDSIASVDQHLMNAAATLGASRMQQYCRVLLPAALPALLDDMRLTIGWAWTYLVVAEMVA
ncbi:MAG: ABC transporter permease, partial [Clostridia bacterium]|nr:ABC transporter permease [Clostridia bacterium]